MIGGILIVKKFKIYPRYSAIITDLNNKSEEDLLKDYRYVRRYEIKKFNLIQELLTAKTDVSFNELMIFIFLQSR